MLRRRGSPNGVAVGVEVISAAGSIPEFELLTNSGNVSGHEIGNGGGGVQVTVVAHCVDGKRHEEEMRISRPPRLDRALEKRRLEHVLAEPRKAPNCDTAPIHLLIESPRTSTAEIPG
nr:hypothetical protein Itr_chr13CG05180 [Ipomoea trifida]